MKKRVLSLALALLMLLSLFPTAALAAGADDLNEDVQIVSLEQSPAEAPLEENLEENQNDLPDALPGEAGEDGEQDNEEDDENGLDAAEVEFGIAAVGAAPVVAAAPVGAATAGTTFTLAQGFELGKQYLIVNGNDGEVKTLANNSSSFTTETVTVSEGQIVYSGDGSSVWEAKETKSGSGLIGLYNDGNVLKTDTSSIKTNSTSYNAGGFGYTAGKNVTYPYSNKTYYIVTSDSQTFKVVSSEDSSRPVYLFAAGTATQPEQPEQPTGRVLSFTPDYSGSGHSIPEVNEKIAVGETVTVQLTNASESRNYTFTVSQSGTGKVSFSPASVAVNHGETGSFTITGDTDGQVTVEVTNGQSQGPRKVIIHLTVGIGGTQPEEPTGNLTYTLSTGIVDGGQYLFAGQSGSSDKGYLLANASTQKFEVTPKPGSAAGSTVTISEANAAKVTWTAKKNTDGSFSFTNDGKYLAAASSTAVETSSSQKSFTVSGVTVKSGSNTLSYGQPASALGSTYIFNFNSGSSSPVLVYALNGSEQGGTPEQPEQKPTGNYIGFTSDVHGNINSATGSLETWFKSLPIKLKNMGYCGDYSYGSGNGYLTDFNNIVALTDKYVTDGGAYTTGNHCWSNGGNSVVSQMQSTSGFVIRGEALNTDDYAVFCLGAQDNSETRNAKGNFSTDDANALDSYLDQISATKPVFVLAHYPLHYFSSGMYNRTTTNAKAIIDVLNQHPNAIFVWGHNHSQGDTHYGEIKTFNDSIQYTSSDTVSNINFTYVCAGSVYSDSQTQYDGVVAEVDGSKVTFSYYDDKGTLLTVKGKNTTALTVDITDGTTPPPAQKTLSSIAITKAPTKTAYTVGESFAPDGMVVTATYSDNSTEAVTGYTYAPNGALALTDTKVTVTYNGKTAEQAITVSSAPTPETKTFTYASTVTAGEQYLLVSGNRALTNASGTSVSATSVTVSNNKITLDANDANYGKLLWTAGSNSSFTDQGTITFKNGSDYFARTGGSSNTAGTENAVSAKSVWTYDGSDLSHKNSDKSLTFYATYQNSSFTVNVQQAGSAELKLYMLDEGTTPPPAQKTLSSIAITKAPTKTAYTVGESFAPAGMVVTATYSDNSTETVTGYTYAPNGALALTDTKVTVTYNGKTAEQEISVSKKAAPAAPTGLNGVACTTASNNDGKITGVNNTMEYRKSGTSAWTAITASTVTGLANGSYEVRVKETADTLPGNAATVTVDAYQAPPTPETKTYVLTNKFEMGKEYLIVNDLSGDAKLLASTGSNDQGNRFTTVSVNISNYTISNPGTASVWEAKAASSSSLIGLYNGSHVLKVDASTSSSPYIKTGDTSYNAGGFEFTKLTHISYPYSNTDYYIGSDASNGFKASASEDGLGKVYIFVLSEGEHSHVYDQEIATNSYLKSAADCTTPATYYKSCVCGDKGSATFTVGSAGGHTFSTAWTSDDTYHWHVATCVHTEEVSGKANHIWDNGTVTTAATATTTGVKTFTCTVCGKTRTETIPVVDPTAKQYLIISNGYALSTKTPDNYTTSGGSYSGFRGVKYTKGSTTVTADMLFDVAISGNSYTISQNGQYLTGTYTSGTGGALTLGTTPATWTYSNNHLTIGSGNLTHSDGTAGVSGNPNVFSMRSNNNAGNVTFEQYTGTVEPPVEEPTDKPTLVNTPVGGGEYIIVSGGYGLTTAVNSGYTNSNGYKYTGFNGTKVTVSGKEITSGYTADMVWKLTQSGSNWTITNVQSGKTLSATYISNGSSYSSSSYTGTLTTGGSDTWTLTNGRLRSNTASNSAGKDLYLKYDTAANDSVSSGNANLFTIRSNNSYSDSELTVQFYQIGTSTPVEPTEYEDNGTILAFSSDVHNMGGSNSSADRLDGWLDKVQTKYGAVSAMGLCGDLANANTSEQNYWSLAAEVISVVNNSGVQGVFTTGNHEWSPGNFGNTTNTTKNSFTRIGQAVSTSTYNIYCFGAANNNQRFEDRDITDLSTYLQSVGKDKFVFVLSHYPLHDNAGGRAMNGEEKVIEVLNNYPNVVFLWGHNHTDYNGTEKNYDQIFTGSLGSQTINFTYAAAGCMSDSEYGNGSAAVKGKGLMVKISDDGKSATFQYLDANGNSVGSAKTVTLSSSGPVTEEIKVGHNLVLSGRIGVNFNMTLPASAQTSGAYMEFKVSGKDGATTRINLSDAQKLTDGRFRFTCYVNAIQMADEITATYHYGSNKTFVDTYSVRTYCEAVVANAGSYDTETVNLIKAIADYGYYAQLAQSEEHGFTVGEGKDHAQMVHYNNVNRNVDLNNFNHTVNGTCPGVTKVTRSLLLDSETQIKIYFTVDNSFSVPSTVKVNGAAAQMTKESDGRYSVIVSGISAHLLGSAYPVQIGNNMTITTSAIAYAKDALANSGVKPSMKDSMASLYQYYVSALAYQKVHP